MEMIVLSFLFSFLLSFARGEGEFIIAHSPPSIQFSGNEPIDQNLIPDICSASLGFTTKHESDWQGIQIADPFHFAEAVVVLYVDGITSLGPSTKFHKFQVDISRDEELTWNKVKNEVVKRFPNEKNTLLRTELGFETEAPSNIKTIHLTSDEEEDAFFLQELKDLENYSKTEFSVNHKDGVPDVYWYVLKGLHVLNDIKGSDDPSTVEAKGLVYQALSKLAERFAKDYHGRVLVAAVVSDASHTRRTRSAFEDADIKNSTDINPAPPSNDDFPAIFNIILWFSVAIVLSLISISVFIASMDPGRDSIIYRMTSNRMKKDS